MNEREIKKLREYLKEIYKREIDLIQTHASWVLLTGEHAYKIKKPVYFGFLDYRTLKARHFFCQKELELNRRLSPDLYLELAPVRQSGGEIKLGKEGAIIDYALKMKELPQDSIMTNLLVSGKIEWRTIAELAKMVAGFHQNLPADERIKIYGDLATIKFNWDENFLQTETFIGQTIKKRSFNFIKKEVARFIEKNEKLFIKRIKNGKIKYCHGDLHSKNIFIADKIYIFDCIEFNERFACSDVASEIAFCLMDLEYYQRKDLADYFLDRYLALTDDYELLKLLTFYKCYRAFVRGKVTSFLLKKEEKEIKELSARYFELAQKYSGNFFKSPKLLVFFGLTGVGKTFLAQKLAKKIEAISLRSDIIRKDLAEISPQTPKLENYRKGIYSSNFTQKTYLTMVQKAKRYLRGGYSVILDATFATRWSRRLVPKELSPIWIYCQASDKLALRRLRGRKKDVSNGRPEIYWTMKRDFYPVKEIKNLITVNTKNPWQRIIKKIEQKLLHF